MIDFISSYTATIPTPVFIALGMVVSIAVFLGVKNLFTAVPIWAIVGVGSVVSSSLGLYILTNGPISELSRQLDIAAGNEPGAGIVSPEVKARVLFKECLPQMLWLSHKTFDIPKPIQDGLTYFFGCLGYAVLYVGFEKWWGPQWHLYRMGLSGIKKGRVRLVNQHDDNYHDFVLRYPNLRIQGGTAYSLFMAKKISNYPLQVRLRTGSIVEFEAPPEPVMETVPEA